MRKYQVRVEPARRFVTTTDSAHALPVAPNLLDRQFEVEAANRRWCADITNVWTGEGWLYLSVVRVQARLRWTCFRAALSAGLRGPPWTGPW